MRLEFTWTRFSAQPLRRGIPVSRIRRGGRCKCAAQVLLACLSALAVMADFATCALDVGQWPLRGRGARRPTMERVLTEVWSTLKYTSSAVSTPVARVVDANLPGFGYKVALRGVAAAGRGCGCSSGVSLSGGMSGSATAMDIGSALATGWPILLYSASHPGSCAKCHLLLDCHRYTRTRHRPPYPWT